MSQKKTKVKKVLGRQGKMRFSFGGLFAVFTLIILALLSVACANDESRTGVGSPSISPGTTSAARSETKGAGNATGTQATKELGNLSPVGGNASNNLTVTGGSGRLKEISLALKTVIDIPLPGGTSRIDYESFDFNKGLLFIAHLGDSSVIVVDIRANKVVTEIKGLGAVHGVLVVPELGRVFATATSDHQLAVIDETNFNIIARIPAGNYPDGLAYDPANHKLYVSDEGGNSEPVIDVQNNAALPSISLDGEGGNTQYDPVSGHIFVNIQTQSALAEIDPKLDKVIGRFQLPGCQENHGLQLDPPQRLAFVACAGNALMLTLDMGQGMKVVGQQSVGQDPDVLALDSENDWLYVACESGVVSVFNVKRPAVQKLAEGTLASGAHIVGVDNNSHRVYIPLNDVNGKPVLRVMEPLLP